MAEQWCPFAVRRPSAMGATAKRGYPDGVTGVAKKDLLNAPKRGEIKHDSTGPLSATLQVLDTHPINSWQFTVDEDQIYQHYPVDANCWHGNDTDPDDDVMANIELVGIEHTRPSSAVVTPLSQSQVELTTKLTAWLQETRERRIATRFGGTFGPAADNEWLLCEHNEVGNDPTACPSGRIPWDLILASLQGDDMSGPARREVDPKTGLEFVYIYNGDVPIRRFGSTNMRNADGSDNRAGREALLFGDGYLWRRYFTDEGVFDATGFLSEVEGD